MAIDRHAGRESPTFKVLGHPDKYIGLINRKGSACRVARGRKCPCSAEKGSPLPYCELCAGDGFRYDFQRKLLQADEDSDVTPDGLTVKPFRVPLIEPLYVHRLLAPEQGGISEFDISSFDSFSIRLKPAQNPPAPWQVMRVSYYFDRFNFVSGDVVQVDASAKILRTVKTKFNDGYTSGNVLNIHGDIALIHKIWDSKTNYVYRDFTFRGNEIQLGNEPAPVANQTLVSYFYVPLTRVLNVDLEAQESKEKWETELLTSSVRFALEPWYELGSGDLITVMSSEFWREETIIHNGPSDLMTEFDISRIDDEIIGTGGIVFKRGIDFKLLRNREIYWIGSQPPIGTSIGVRYSYHPTFKIFKEQPVPNNLENKQYPLIVTAALFNRTHPYDAVPKENPSTFADPNAEANLTAAELLG